MKKQFLYFLLTVPVFLLLWSACTNEPEPTNESALWPEIEPFHSDYLKVSDIHDIYYELCGNPEGIPVFVIHGGPGGGCSPYYRRFFNPETYHIILHDQRGGGKSIPNAELRQNTTQELIEDIERLRSELKFDQIILFGGSWGTTLSLAYAETYPDNVKAMVLRGIFLPTQEEEALFYTRLKNYYPELYHQALEVMPDNVTVLNDSVVFALFQTEDKVERFKYMKSIGSFEFKGSFLNVEDSLIAAYYDNDKNFNDIYTLSLISYHYFSNDCFLEEDQLLKNIHKIQDIPVTIIHGRYDMMCQPIYAYRLHKQLPNSKLIIAEKAGHSMSEPPIEKELLNAMRDLEKKF